MTRCAGGRPPSPSSSTRSSRTRSGPSIDPQGAVNEQATLYENFVYTLWQTALPALAACGYQLPGWITARIAKLPAFLGSATEPDGDLVQIGDSYVERPADVGPRHALVSVYPQAGYVFGRSGWTPAASFYSLRFGPGREIHGHNDHMGLTYYARGRDLIVDAGHDGYAATPYRTWLQSPEAASTLVLPGVPFSPGAATALVADQIGVRAVLRALRHGLRRRPPVPVGLRQPAAGPDGRLRPGHGGSAPRPTSSSGTWRRAAVTRSGLLRGRVGTRGRADARPGGAARPGHPPGSTQVAVGQATRTRAGCRSRCCSAPRPTP